MSGAYDLGDEVKGEASPLPLQDAPQEPVAPRQMNYGLLLLRDVFLGTVAMEGPSFAIGFVFTFLLAFGGQDVKQSQAGINGLAEIVSGIIYFIVLVVLGCLKREKRIGHLMVVAVIVRIIDAILLSMMGLPITSSGFIGGPLFMGLFAGLISYIFVKDPKEPAKP